MRTDKNWIITATGKQFWPLDPRPEDIDIRDIAHALSLVNRYGGHTPTPYSVAEHSLYVAEYVAARHGRPLRALLHDASEAYLGDMVRPVKHQLPEFQAAEDRLQAVIEERFGLTMAGVTEEDRACTKEADNAILRREQALFFRPETHPAAVHIHLPPGTEPLERRSSGWAGCWAVRDEFLSKFKEYGGKP